MTEKQTLHGRACTAQYLHKGIALLALGLLPAGPVMSLDESRLWLPKSHADLKIKLFKAAKLAEDLPACVEVVSGTLYEGQSDVPPPVFKMICRNAERRTYPVLMDGNDYVYLNPPPEPEPQEQKDPEVERREREAEYWRLCEEGVQSRSANMIDVEWLYSGPVLPAYSGADNLTVHFELPFDARDIQGNVLHFKGVCEFHSLEEQRIQLRPRRD